MKRKAADAGLPERLACEPVQGQGAGPFAVYFPAGTDPNAGGGLRWEAQASVQQRNTYVLTAKSVSRAQQAQCCSQRLLRETIRPHRARGGARRPPSRRDALCLLSLPTLTPASTLHSQADDVVNYHGSSSNPEYAGALPCK